MTYLEANNLVEIDNKQTEAHPPGWGQFVPRILELPPTGKGHCSQKVQVRVAWAPGARYDLI
jgi:hypothetical protein